MVIIFIKLQQSAEVPSGRVSNPDNMVPTPAVSGNQLMQLHTKAQFSLSVGYSNGFQQQTLSCSQKVLHSSLS